MNPSIRWNTLHDLDHDGPQARKREWLEKLHELRAQLGDTLDDDETEEW